MVYTDVDKTAAIINGMLHKMFVYEGNNLLLTTHVKSLIEYADDYARSIATGELYYEKLYESYKLDLS